MSFSLLSIAEITSADRISDAVAILGTLVILCILIGWLK